MSIARRATPRPSKAAKTIFIRTTLAQSQSPLRTRARAEHEQCRVDRREKAQVTTRRTFTPAAAIIIAISAPLVGVDSVAESRARFSYASTVTCRDNPNSKSESGTSKGIVNTACPLTLGTGNTWIMVCSADHRASADAATGRWESGVNSAFTTEVSTMRPSSITTKMARANPMSMAA